MSATHTTVQWRIRSASKAPVPGLSVIEDTHGVFIATVALERSNLLAAAPELLEALRESQNQLATVLAESRRYGFSNERINMMSAANVQARAAIAKAEGRT